MEALQMSLFIVQIIIALALVGIVLLQKADEDSLSGIGGGMGVRLPALSSKASASILTKITIILAFIFMTNCLVLGILSARVYKTEIATVEQYIEQQEKISLPKVTDNDKSSSISIDNSITNQGEKEQSEE